MNQKEKEIEFTPQIETEWISTLKKFGIIEKKDEKEANEQDSIENKVSKLDDKFNNEDLDEIFDDLNEEDEREFEKYRLKRLMQLKNEYDRKKFGEVMEITRQNYVDEVNKAGEDIWVILHVYKPGLLLCNLINQHLSLLALKFKTTKFLKSIVDLCIPNFPEENLPAIFIYYNGEVKKKFLGDQIGNINLKCEDLEWIFFRCGALESDLKCDPKKKREKNTKTFLSYSNNESDIDSD